MRLISFPKKKNNKTVNNTKRRLNKTFLNNEQVTEEIKICTEMNENENKTTQNLWDSVKAVLRRRFIAIQAYLKKQTENSNRLLTQNKIKLVHQTTHF